MLHRFSNFFLFLLKPLLISHLVFCQALLGGSNDPLSSLIQGIDQLLASNGVVGKNTEVMIGIAYDDCGNIIRFSVNPKSLSRLGGNAAVEALSKKLGIAFSVAEKGCAEPILDKFMKDNGISGRVIPYRLGIDNPASAMSVHLKKGGDVPIPGMRFKLCEANRCRHCAANVANLESCPSISTAVQTARSSVTCETCFQRLGIATRARAFGNNLAVAIIPGLTEAQLALKTGAPYVLASAPAVYSIKYVSAALDKIAQFGSRIGPGGFIITAAITAGVYIKQQEAYVLAEFEKMQKQDAKPNYTVGLISGWTAIDVMKNYFSKEEWAEVERILNGPQIKTQGDRARMASLLFGRLLAQVSECEQDFLNDQWTKRRAVYEDRAAKVRAGYKDIGPLPAP